METADLDAIIAWPLQDILNEDFSRNKVGKIPERFCSEEEYLGSFRYSLIEETRAELASSLRILNRAPFAKVVTCEERGRKNIYTVTLDSWISVCGTEKHRPLLSDFVILANGRPKSLVELQNAQTNTWSLAVVKGIYDENANRLDLLAPKDIKVQGQVYIMFLINITTPRRISKSLDMTKGREIIKGILDYNQDEGSCQCELSQIEDPQVVAGLNSFQICAIKKAIYKANCTHRSYVDLIWGPPATGKTKTVIHLLIWLLEMRVTTLMCAPTNAAVRLAADGVFALINGLPKRGNWSTGDIVIIGSKQRLKLDNKLDDIYLEERVKRVFELAQSWEHNTQSMLDKFREGGCDLTLFLRNKEFTRLAKALRTCVDTLLKDVPRRFIGDGYIASINSLVDQFGALDLIVEDLRDGVNAEMQVISDVISVCLPLLERLHPSLRNIGLSASSNTYEINKFCVEKAALIFCTASTSFELHSYEDLKFDYLVVDEAGRLKEAESTIPLQLPGIKHAVLVGDEFQLSAMVTSKISLDSGFERSLFGRLSLLGHPKHLLKVQYRMNADISLFPNKKFYRNELVDGGNLISEMYLKQYNFGSYAFINVADGKELLGDDGQSRKNMVEAAIAYTLVKDLYSDWQKQEPQKKLSIGVLSPYAAQVRSIQNSVGRICENDNDKFSVIVKTIDGFQGREADIIILSTVDSNVSRGSRLISNLQRTNVALTRARHCLWILGNKISLNNVPVWKELAGDASERLCLFDAADNVKLNRVILHVKTQLQEFDDLCSGNSAVFKNAEWKVFFSDSFKKTFRGITDKDFKGRSLMSLLRICQGHRPDTKSEILCEKSVQVIRQFKISDLYFICSVDILKQEDKYVQVLNVWDLLPLDGIPRLKNHLENLFQAYTEDYLKLCTIKNVDGKKELPMTWPLTQGINRLRGQILPRNEGANEGANAGENEVENEGGENDKPKVSESLRLLRFYPLSDDVVKHLLSEKDIDMPLHVTEEQRDILSERRTTFILGRSGTGKTTVLAMKLLQNEEGFRVACEGDDAEVSSTVREVRDPEAVDDDPLRQLFVTVSPRLCQAVNKQVLKMKSFSSDPNLPAVVEADIPNTFEHIPKERYPLVVTFQKLLLMLDGTFGQSFLGRFREDKEGFDADVIRKRREVSYEKFCRDYWIHLNRDLTRKFDPSRVFTEIISHVKGGVEALASHGGILPKEDYVSLERNRSSSLTEEERRDIYALYEAYERKKTRRKEFDLGDFVNHIYNLLKTGGYRGDQMDFIFIDEVQDLCVKQICLFKYLCHHHDKGFIFAGDTAQTIAKGVDFRFQDIKSLFHKEFSKYEDKGVLMQLTQNFRTHSGVLNLANSIIQMLTRYFPDSVDKLKPETSSICGEAPVLVECEVAGDSVIKTIVGEKKEGGGFGADQVILVRDENSKKEICELVEKNALVLTIMECKGLEFEDVLLYNFFGTSPFKKWRAVIKSYVKDANLIKEYAKSSQEFDEPKHSVLCSELKELYVAITRTRHRLWICENKEELSLPMYEYWKDRGLVLTIKLNESVAQAMRATSSPEEWMKRGRELFEEENFMMATMCFEKAGDKKWESRAKAFGLKKLAYELEGIDPVSFLTRLKEAAQMFMQIGEDEPAAECYTEVENYEGQVKDNKEVKKGANPERTADKRKEEDDFDSGFNLNWDFLTDIKKIAKGNKNLKPNKARNANHIRVQVERLLYMLHVCPYPIHQKTYRENQLQELETIAKNVSYIWPALKMLYNSFDTSKQGPVYDEMLNDYPLGLLLGDIRDNRASVDKHWNNFKKLVPEGMLKTYLEKVKAEMGEMSTWKIECEERYQFDTVAIPQNLDKPSS